MCFPKLSNIQWGYIFGIIGLVIAGIALITEIITNPTHAIELQDILVFILVVAGLMVTSLGIVLLQLGKIQDQINNLNNKE